MRKTALILTALLLVGCGKAPEATAGKTEGTAEPSGVALAGSAAGDSASAMPPGHPATGVPAGAPGLTGTVLETMDAAGYTYLRLKTAEGETWAAVNATKVAVGDTVSVLNPMPMDGFESATLNRKFDHIVFGTLGPGSAAAAPAAPPAGMPSAMTGAPAGVPASMAAQHAAAAGGPETTEKISVARAEGADGRTVAELHAQRAALKGKSVAVRGKVVKFNGGIMGKNWVHLRDGSGTPEGKDHDLTVTTQETVAKGDVVLVKGTVAIDRDFGSGYTYALVLEDAKVTK